MTSKPLWPESYGLHPDHCRDVVEGGSYDVPFNPSSPPTILDLGSNVGGFVRWAVKRWPGCTIHAYEPCPSNFKLLERTVEDLIDVSDDVVRVLLHQQAVAGHACRAVLQAGEFNCGEWSLMMPEVAGRERVEVDVIAATDLPQADVLKIDVEGAEIAVLAALTLAGRISELSAIMMETHNDDWIAPIKANMAKAGFTLTGEAHPHLNRAELKFVRTDLLPADFKL
jgi:FkbM family methyltransferase